MLKNAPYDPNKNCGVITPEGKPCGRSLTCKTHSMGAKRSVPGRSAPYDVLLYGLSLSRLPSFSSSFLSLMLPFGV